MGFLIPRDVFRQDKSSLLNIARFATETEFWRAQGNEWNKLIDLLECSLAAATTSEGRKLMRAIQCLALLCQIEATDLRDDLEETLQFFSFTESIACRQEKIALGRALEAIYGDLPDAETARAEQASISPFSNGASGIDASGYSYRGVDEDKYQTLAYYGFDDEGVGM